MFGNYPIEAIANSILDECEKRGIRLTPMKLQKLLYLAHGYYVAITGQPLIDEDFEAWKYGPVAPSRSIKSLRTVGTAVRLTEET
jgi:uncharacterized phage-associated protein